VSSYSRVRGSHFRLPRAAPLHCPKMLPLAPPLLPPAPSLLSPAPSLLPLKRPCSLSRPRTAISNPKFGVYIIYIYTLLLYVGRAPSKIPSNIHQPHPISNVAFGNPFRVLCRCFFTQNDAGAPEIMTKCPVYPTEGAQDVCLQ